MSRRALLMRKTPQKHDIFKIRDSPMQKWWGPVIFLPLIIFVVGKDLLYWNTKPKNYVRAVLPPTSELKKTSKEPLHTVYVSRWLESAGIDPYPGRVKSKTLTWDHVKLLEPSFTVTTKIMAFWTISFIGPLKWRRLAGEHQWLNMEMWRTRCESWFSLHRSAMKTCTRKSCSGIKRLGRESHPSRPKMSVQTSAVLRASVVPVLVYSRSMPRQKGQGSWVVLCWVGANANCTGRKGWCEVRRNPGSGEWTTRSVMDGSRSMPKKEWHV